MHKSGQYTKSSGGTWVKGEGSEELDATQQNVMKDMWEKFKYLPSELATDYENIFGVQERTFSSD